MMIVRRVPTASGPGSGRRESRDRFAWAPRTAARRNEVRVVVMRPQTVPHRPARRCNRSTSGRVVSDGMDPSADRPARARWRGRTALLLALTAVATLVLVVALVAKPRDGGSIPSPGSVRSSSSGPARVALEQVATGVPFPVGITNAG